MTSSIRAARRSELSLDWNERGYCFPHMLEKKLEFEIQGKIGIKIGRRFCAAFGYVVKNTLKGLPIKPNISVCLPTFAVR
jgi:hypothetical protein